MRTPARGTQAAQHRCREGDLKAGRIPDAWKANPAKLAQKDGDARWTIKWSKAKPAEDGSKQIDIAVPGFGYKNHVGIDRRHGLIRTWITMDTARNCRLSSRRPTPPATCGRTRPTARS